jgi:hypothetical protein
MFTGTSRFLSTLAGICLAGSAAFAGAITIPTLTVDALTGSASFVFTGTMTQADTISLVEVGSPCLQPGVAYCVNGAGVITIAGTTGVGGTTTFGGTFGTTSSNWNFGSLLLTINNGQTVQLFAPNAANGLGSATPPTSLTLGSISFASLGFSAFSLVNPTLKFTLADTFYGDNSSAFVINPSSNGVPEPATFGLVGLALIAVATIHRRRL